MWKKIKEGIGLPEFIVAGCGRTVQEVYRERDEGRSLTRRGGRRKASSNLIRDSFCLSSSSTLQKFFLCFPRDEQLQNFLGPQADACFGATPVPNVGKSSALLMSGAWKRRKRNVYQLAKHIYSNISTDSGLNKSYTIILLTLNHDP